MANTARSEQPAHIHVCVCVCVLAQQAAHFKWLHRKAFLPQVEAARRSAFANSQLKIKLCR